MNIDLPRKVRYNARRVACHLKVDKACRIGRTYEDFKGYLLEYPDLAITQLDSVGGAYQQHARPAQGAFC